LSGDPSDTVSNISLMALLSSSKCASQTIATSDQ
jgi:hypothetical protein